MPVCRPRSPTCRGSCEYRLSRGRALTLRTSTRARRRSRNSLTTLVSLSLSKCVVRRRETGVLSVNRPCWRHARRAMGDRRFCSTRTTMCSPRATMMIGIHFRTSRRCVVTGSTVAVRPMTRRASSRTSPQFARLLKRSAPISISGSWSSSRARKSSVLAPSSIFSTRTRKTCSRM